MTYRALREANVLRKRRVVERIRSEAETDPALLAYARRQTERERRWTSPKRGDT